jgi:putative transposase
LTLAGNKVLVQVLFIVGRKKHEIHREAGLKVTYDTKSKEHKQAEEENRVLRKLLSDREIELEVQRELVKKKFGPSDPRKI